MERKHDTPTVKRYKLHRSTIIGLLQIAVIILPPLSVVVNCAEQIKRPEHPCSHSRIVEAGPIKILRLADHFFDQIPFRTLLSLIRRSFSSNDKSCSVIILDR
jgi:hypothetical protein